MNSKLFSLLAAFAITSGVATAQTSVTTGGVKKVLIEEGTGAWCGYCVDGALDVDLIRAANPNAIAVSIHNGDGMTTPEGNTYVSAYITGFPKGTVDRALVNGQTAVGLGRNLWASAATERSALTPQVDVTMTHSYNASTKTITINVTAKTLVALTGDYNLNAYVVEDSVSGTGANYDQHNYYSHEESSPAGGTSHPYYNQPGVIVGFKHMQVVRKMLGGTYGTTGVITTNSATNKTYTKTYTYVIPTTQNASRLKLVGMVMKNNTSDPNDRQILNSVQAKFMPFALGVSQLPVLDEVSIYPNPATSTISVSGQWTRTADVKLTLTNTLGQTVYTKNMKGTSGANFQEAIEVSHLSAGLYILHLQSEGTEVMQKVSVAH